MVDDTYYITPHEAALAVVATSMKKSRLPFHILFINSIIGGFLFSAGGMLYIMCEAGSQGLIPEYTLFLWIAQGSVFVIGLFYVIVCGMELFNSNILFFSTGVMRGAVTLMDLFISWFVSFWVNLASTIFVVYVVCHLSGVMKQPAYVAASVAIAQAKDTYSFGENIMKGVAGNFFVCLAVYLQIMVKPLHVKLIVMYLPIFTFVAMGFTHCVADMFMVPAGIFNNCGYGFGHYFWKIMLPGTIGNMLGGSFFGVVIPWYLHLYVIESDMKKLNLPAYEERDEQPMLNMDSRVVRVPTHISPTSSCAPSVIEFKPNSEMDLSRVTTSATGIGSTLSHTLSRVPTTMSLRNRINKPIRSPKGVFPVVDMGQPLQREKTIAGAYDVPSTNIDDIIEKTRSSNISASAQSYDSRAGSTDLDDLEDNEGISIYSGEDQLDNQYTANAYDPEEKIGAKLKRALSRTITRDTHNDIEMGPKEEEDDDDTGLLKTISRTATRIQQSVEAGVSNKIKPPQKAKTKEKKLVSIPKASPADALNKSTPPIATPDIQRPSISSTSSQQQPQSGKRSSKLFRQFTFGGGGDDADEIHRRLADAKITKRAAGMSNDIAGIHVDTVDKRAHVKSKRSNSLQRKPSDSPTVQINDPKLGGPYSTDRWKNFTYDYDLDGELPVSFISERSDEESTEKPKNVNN